MEEAAWPWTTFGIYCYSEMEPNVGQGKKQKVVARREKEYVLKLFAPPSTTIAKDLKKACGGKQVGSGPLCKKVAVYVTTDWEDFQCVYELLENKDTDKSKKDRKAKKRKAAQGSKPLVFKTEDGREAGYL